jgi:uncharacterized protein
MELSTVRAAAERLIEDNLVNEGLSVIWHAGEPLTMPISFYEKATDILDNVLGSRCNLSHCVQTNAMLINDEWCNLFKRHNFRVGISIDGPANIHDIHRRTRTGKGTHQMVLKGIEVLRKHDIAFHAIAVITANTLTQSDAFYDFFLEHGISEVGCNYDEAEGPHLSSTITNCEVEYEAFIKKLIKRSNVQGQPVRFRELSTAMSRINSALPTYSWRKKEWPVNLQTMPFAIVNVAHNGDFSTFSPELLGQTSLKFKSFTLGNVTNSGYFASTQFDRFKQIWNGIIRGTQRCEINCAHYQFCGGGAPVNKLYENGDFDSGETLYCRSTMIRPFNAVLEYMEQVLLLS